MQVHGSAFYRNKAVRNREDRERGRDAPSSSPGSTMANARLVLDTVILDSESISVLFSLSRAYFMVGIDVPSG